MSSSRPVQLVVFDWAGTIIDFGSRAPAASFCGVFAAHGVQVSEAEARAPMGLNKREHLLAMLLEPGIAERWLAANQRPWSDQDVNAMYHEFMPVQLAAIPRHAELTPGLLAVAAKLRARGIKLGGTTGYFRAATDLVTSLAAQAGFTLDANACADDVPQGRPAPWMIFRVMERLGVYPPAAVVNVGDTVADIKAGLAAGCWSVGVCDSSSLTGLSGPEFAQLSPAARKETLTRTANTFRAAGCHAVLETLGDLPRLIETIERTAGPTVIS